MPIAGTWEQGVAQTAGKSEEWTRSEFAVSEISNVSNFSLFLKKMLTVLCCLTRAQPGRAKPAAWFLSVWFGNSGPYLDLSLAQLLCCSFLQKLCCGQLNHSTPVLCLLLAFTESFSKYIKMQRCHCSLA